MSKKEVMGAEETKRLLKSGARVRLYGDTFHISVWFAQQGFTIGEIEKADKEAKDYVRFTATMMNKALERFREAIERNMLEKLSTWLENPALLEAYDSGELKDYLRRK